MPAVDPTALLIVATSGTYLVAAHRRDLALAKRWSHEASWMLAAVAVGTVALVGPLDASAGGSVTWHMVQHVLLIAVVSPLAVLGRPHEILPWLLPDARRRQFAHAGRRWSRRAAAHPLAAVFTLIVTICCFHVPSVYDAAVRSAGWHIVEHVSFLAAGGMFWWTLVGTRHTATYGRSLLPVFVLALASSGIGSLLVATERPLYSLATQRPVAERVADQQLAGVIMWAFGGIATSIAALSLFAVWLREAERRDASIQGARMSAIGPILPVVIAVAGTLVMAAEPPPPPTDTSTEVAPAAIFERDCAECHGARGGGTDKAPPLVDVGAADVDFVVSTGRMPLDDPSDEVERGDPAYDRSTSIALARYVASLGGEREPPEAWPIPDVDLETADVANGGVLYRLNCAACHQSVGAGGALLQGAAPPLTEATPTQIAEAVRVGPFEMPSFGEAAMSDDDVRDVTAYVTDVVQHPDDRGGWSIGHLGPIPEGVVAIFLGLAALILIAIWIEYRPNDA